MITDWLETSRNVIDNKVREGLYDAYILGRNDGYNQALEDFSKRILNWKPQDEEYRSFRDVINEVKNQLIKQTFKEWLNEQ